MNKLTIIGFASTRSVQIAAAVCVAVHHALRFASTRSVQIAASPTNRKRAGRLLCLHTLRADCSACSLAVRSS